MGQNIVPTTTPDLLYANIKEAYHVTALPPLGRSDQNLVSLTKICPSYPTTTGIHKDWEWVDSGGWWSTAGLLWVHRLGWALFVTRVRTLTAWQTVSQKALKSANTPCCKVGLYISSPTVRHGSPLNWKYCSTTWGEPSGLGTEKNWGEYSMPQGRSWGSVKKLEAKLQLQ